MPIILTCRSCGAPVRIPDQFVGSGLTLACPHCHTIIVGGGPGSSQPPAQRQTETVSSKPISSEPPAAKQPPRSQPLPQPKPSKPAVMPRSSPPAAAQPASRSTPKRQEASKPKPPATSKPTPPAVTKPPGDEDWEEVGGAYEVQDAVVAATEHIPSLEEERMLEEVRSGMRQRGGRRTPGRYAQWKKVRLGITLILTAHLIFAGVFLVQLLVLLCLWLSGPVMPGSAALSWLGFISLVMLLALLAANVLLIAGHGFDVAAPREHGTKTLASAALILVAFVYVSCCGVSVSSSSLRIGAAATDASPRAAAWAAAFTGVAGLLVALIYLASFFVFLFFLRAVALCMNTVWLARSIMGLIVLVAATVVLSLIMAFTMHGMILSNVTGLFGGVNNVESTFTFAQVMFYLQLFLGFIILIWLIAVLFQARGAITDVIG